MWGSETADGDETLPRNTRRTFLAGAGAAAVAGLAAACTGSEQADDGTAVEGASDEGAVVPTIVARGQATAPVSFRGPHQSGVLVDPAPSGMAAAFDVAVSTREELVALMQTLSNEIERIMGDQLLDQTDEFLPPVDSGAIGPESGTAGVSITVAVGASLFDERFGLADRRPRELIPMPQFFNDRLVRNELSHGDLLVTVTAPNQQAAAFSLHQIVHATERRLQLRWLQEGYNQILPEAPGQLAHTRNLMGFRDGTSNLDAADDQQMRDHVWVQPGDGEPEWAVGGTYQAVRVIRMLIEFWATAALVRQEQIFGRHRDTGAPLGQSNEADEPAFVSNPNDDEIPARAHMRLANPRTPGASRIMRRGFSYLNGVDERGTLDQGLLFVCYQRSLSRGFLDVQGRLDGEPLEDYIKPVGGGLFFVLPGPGANQDDPDWLGRTLFVA